MFDESQEAAVIEAYDFACKVGKEHIKNIEKNASANDKLILKTIRSRHSVEELKKRVFDLAIEYHYCKAPSSTDGLISKLETIEAELKSLISKFDSLKNTAPDTFDDIAELMHSPYLRSGELKAQTFTYYDPQIELKHLIRSVGLAMSSAQTRTKKSKKRGIYWHRIEKIWSQITNKRPQTGQNSDFITFSVMVFNAGKNSENPEENAQALNRAYRRYLETKRSATQLPKSMDKND